MIQAMDSTASVGTVAKVRPQGATLSSAQAQRLADMGDSIKVGFELKLPRGSTGVGELMDEYTMLANREVGIIRKADGSRVMRFGGEKHVPVRADERLIVHTHPSGNLKLSPKGIDPKTGAPTGDIAAMEAQNLHSTVIRDPWTSKAARLSRRTNKPCKTSEGYAQ